MEFELSLETQNPIIMHHWDTLNQRFKTFSKLHSLDPGVNSQSSNPLLLHLGGDALLELITTSVVLKKEGDSTVRDLLVNIETLCLPKFILLYERYKLFACRQKSDECVCQFLSQLARLVELCGLEGDVEACIKDRILHGITDICLREQLLLIKDRDLNSFVEACQGYSKCETGKCCEYFVHFIDEIHNLENIETIVPDLKCELEEINSLFKSSSKNVTKFKTSTERSSEALLDELLLLKKEEYNLVGPVHKISESSIQPVISDSLLTESLHNAHNETTHPIENMLPLNEKEATKFLTENVIVTVPSMIQPQFKMETIEDGMPSLVPPPREDSPIPIFVSFDDTPARNKQNGFFELYDKWLDKPCEDRFGECAQTENTEISDNNSSKTDDVTGSETNDPSTETNDPTTSSETDDEDCVFIPVSPSPTVIVSDDEDDEASEKKHVENNPNLRVESSLDLCELRKVNSGANTFFDKYETLVDTFKDSSTPFLPKNHCSSLSILHERLVNKINNVNVSGREEEKHEANGLCYGDKYRQHQVIGDKDLIPRQVSSVSKHSQDPETEISSDTGCSVPNTLLYSFTPSDGKPQYDRTPQLHRTPQHDKTLQCNRTPQYNRTPQHDRTLQYNRTPQHDSTLQYDRTPQYDRTLQYDRTPQHDRTPQRQCITTLRKKLIKTHTGSTADNTHPLDDTSNNTEKSVSTLSLINIFKTDALHYNGAHYNGTEYTSSGNNVVSGSASESRKCNIASVVLLKNKRNISDSKKSLNSTRGSLPSYFSKRPSKKYARSSSSLKSKKISQAFISDVDLSSNKYEDKTASNFWGWAETMKQLTHSGTETMKQLTHPDTESRLVCSTADTRNSLDTSSVLNRDLTCKRSLSIEEEEINLQSKRKNGGKISVLSIVTDT